MTNRNRVQLGDPDKAVLAHPRQPNPDSEQYHHLVALIEDRGSVTVEARSGVMAVGWAPGDKLRDKPRPLTLNDGCVARLIVEQAPAFNQRAETLALLVATGQLDIVDDDAFADARPHDEVHEALRTKDLARQSRRAGTVGMHGNIIALLDRVAELENAGEPDHDADAASEAVAKAAAAGKKATAADKRAKDAEAKIAALEAKIETLEKAAAA